MDYVEMTKRKNTDNVVNLENKNTLNLKLDIPPEAISYTLLSEPDDYLFTSTENISILNTPQYKYNEDKILKEVQEYVASTYKGHYVRKGELQTTDIWEMLGSADTTARDTAIKYLMRYGKKEGYNKKDLLKAIHYIILLYHYTQEIEKNDDSFSKSEKQFLSE